MTRLVLFSLLVAATVLAFPTAAQTAQVVPPNPTSSDLVVVRVSGASGWIGATVSRTGNHFQFDPAPCPILCFSSFDIELGMLAGGTYTFELRDDGNVIGSGAFEVIDLIPALSPMALAVFSALLAIAGVAILSRYNFL
jgi:hypothetical protein